MNALRRITKELLPPMLVRLLRRLQPAPKYGIFGDYLSYKAALDDCIGGYATENVVRPVAERMCQLREQLAAGPTAILLDSRMLQNLAALLLAVHPTRRLSVLDFGGALGMHYHQLRPYLGGGALSWTICETVPMAEEGAQSFTTEGLQFVSSLTGLQGRRFDVAFASGALQYVEDPVLTLRQLASVSNRLVLNRVPFANSDSDRIAVQRVDPCIHEAAYPIWFFSRQKWLAQIDELGFDVLMRWQVPEDATKGVDKNIHVEGLVASRRV